MIEVSATEVIEALVSDVFVKMSRLETLHEWLVGCEKAWAVSDDPYQVGGRVAHIDSVMGQTFEAHYEVVEWVPNERLVFQTLSGGPFEGTSDLTFEEEGGDATRVEICITGRLKGAMKFGDWAARKVAQKQLVESVQNAKRMIEGLRA